MPRIHRSTNRFSSSIAVHVIEKIALVVCLAASARAQPDITMQPGDQFIDPGGTAVFSLAASGSSAERTYQWFCNEHPLVDATNPVLRFANAQPALNAEYYAVASDASGAVTSQLARLKLFVPAPHTVRSLRVEPTGVTELILGGETRATFGRYFALHPVDVSSNLSDWTPLAMLVRTNASVVSHK